MHEVIFNSLLISFFIISSTKKNLLLVRLKKNFVFEVITIDFRQDVFFFFFQKKKREKGLILYLGLARSSLWITLAGLLTHGELFFCQSLEYSTGITGITAIMSLSLFSLYHNYWYLFDKLKTEMSKRANFKQIVGMDYLQ